jgi:hypothetical protein
VTTKTVGQQQAHQRQLLRRSNATVPIPHGQHKKPRSMQRQEIKESYR